MMGSVIAGWVLFGLGLIIYAVVLVEKVRKMTRGSEESLDTIKDTVEALAKLADTFSKFSDSMQLLLLGTGCLIAGIYLLSTQPF
jgi:hypothetical protein